MLSSPGYPYPKHSDMILHADCYHKGNGPDGERVDKRGGLVGSGERRAYGYGGLGGQKA